MSDFETFGFNIKEEGGQATLDILDNILDRLEKIQKLQNGGIGVKTQAKSTTTRRRSSAEVKDMKLLHSNMEQVNASITKLNENLLLTLQTISKIASTSKSLPSNIPTLKGRVDFANYGKVNPKDIENANIDASTKSYKNYLNAMAAQREMNGAQYKAIRSLQLLNAEEKKRIDQQLKLELRIKNTNKGLLTYGIRLTTVIAAARKLARFASEAIKESAAYTENLNLFAVTFGETYKDNAKWALNIADSFGLASSEVIRFTGLFKQLSTAIGNTAETGDKMSKVLTQFGYDLASFYNIDVTSAMEKLQAGIYSGQTKPLRSIGIDVTYQSIDNLLQNNAELAKFNTSSKQLDQSQKAIARLIISLQSGSNAFGDMGETIGSLSNQLRVFEGSLANLKLAIGDMVNKPLAEALVYINGFIQGITRVIKSLFPSQTEDKNIVANLGADADETNEALDETQKRLAGFDKFNVLKTTSASGIQADLAITEALTKELEKQMELYEQQNKEIGIAAKKMEEIATKVHDFFIDDENGESGLSKLTTEAEILKGTLITIASLIGVELVSKGVVKIVGFFKNVVAGAKAAGRTVSDYTQMVVRAGDATDLSMTKTQSAFTKATVAMMGFFASFSLFTLIGNQFEGTARGIYGACIALVGAILGIGFAIAIARGAINGAVGAAASAVGFGMVAAGVWKTIEGFADIDLPFFADGGYTNANMIITHENRKKEWVGRQGGSSVIVNDAQMSDIMTMAVAKGTYEANMASGQNQGGSQVIHNHIYLDGKQIYEGVTDTAKRYGHKR